MMSAYDITKFMRTAYGPFANCVPSKPPSEYCVQKEGGVTLILESYSNSQEKNFNYVGSVHFFTWFT